MADVISGDLPRRPSGEVWRSLIETCSNIDPGYTLLPQGLLADIAIKSRPTLAGVMGRALVRFGLFLQEGEGAHG